LLFKEVKVPRAVYREVIRESKKEADKLKDYLLSKIVNLENERNIIIKEGHITNIKSRIEMIKNSDIYLSEELLQRIMSLAGES
jgi:transcription antitermination factor NusG